MANEYDVLVIGAGPGGYVCAIRAAQLGFSVACVEKRETLGGTCLNVGCIPSKALLSTSEKFEEAGHHYPELGIETGTPKLNLKKMLAHKDKVVEANVGGVDYLFKKNKVARYTGAAQFSEKNRVRITDGKDKGTEITAKHIVIATGSESMPLKGVETDEKRILTSTGALDLPKVPKSMIVIGGGYIGLEMGTVWRRLGARVTVIEYLDRILPAMDSDVSKEMHKILAKQGIEFKLGARVTGAKIGKNDVSLTVEPAAGGEAETLKAETVLLAIGRRPHTDGLGLDTIGVAMDDRGFVEIDAKFRTNIEGVYALGDAIKGPMLAHKAEDEGVVLAEMLAGQGGHVDYNTVPAVVYTWPEVAQVGQTEDALKKQGTDYKTGKFPFAANGRARAMNYTDGFVKILADARTDRVLGVHIVGPEAGTLIAEAVAVMDFGGSAEDIARISHAHPTLSESVKEAALAVDGRPIHI